MTEIAMIIIAIMANTVDDDVISSPVNGRIANSIDRIGIDGLRRRALHDFSMPNHALGIGYVILSLERVRSVLRLVASHSGSAKKASTGTDRSARACIPAERSDRSTCGSTKQSSGNGRKRRIVLCVSGGARGCAVAFGRICTARGVVLLELRERLSRAWHSNHTRAGRRCNGTGAQR